MPLDGPRQGSSGRIGRFGTLLATLVILFAGTGLLDYIQTYLPGRVVHGITILLLTLVLVAAVTQVSGRRGPSVRVPLSFDFPWVGCAD